jgi:hypothetical protein
VSYAAFIEALLLIGVEVRSEQHFTRTDRIGGIRDDHVEFVGAVSHEVFAVGDHDVGFRIVVSA